jgi:glycerol-3-phosphate dehydrogenase
MSFSNQDRRISLSRMADEVFDLAIIGGGINGAGVARDAASRGMRVALVEASDYASGTSSRSSKLIHGGIRYLENLEFGLVFEALNERQRLFTMAPHLVHPLKFLIPIYSTGRVPAWKMSLGMWAYDALSLFEAPEMHAYLGPRELAAEYPQLQKQNLTGGFTYYDAYMDDDRLVHETLRSARSFGAEIVNYVRVTGCEMHGGRMTGVECHDLEGGQRLTVRARHFVGSVGPWTDILGGQLFHQWRRRLRPSKGVHLTFSRQRFPLRDAVVMGAESRIVFAIPRHDMVIVGTTDTDFTIDPSEVRTEPEDVRYLLDVVARYFPGARLGREDIIGCYAGVRPLIDDGAKTESKTSREHEIWTDARGITFVAGGKYTTYRNMARQTVDEVLHHFPIEDRVRFSHSRTLVPLNPLATEEGLERARAQASEWADETGLPKEVTSMLADRHGLEAKSVLAGAADVPKDEAQSWLWCAEARHAVKNTMCLHLADFYFRRTPLVLSRPDHGLPFVVAVAKVMGAQLGWSSSREEEEINALQNQIRCDLSATFSFDQPHSVP